MTRTVNAKSAAPIRKVAAGGAAGAITTILVWMASQLLHMEIPEAVASAFTLVIMFGASYLTPSAAGDAGGIINP